MNTDEKARELMAGERHHEEHIHENMLSRAIEHPETESVDETETKARELMVEDRQHEEHIHDSMLSRATEEIQ